MRRDEDKWEPIDSLGETGATVARNVRRVRKKRGLQYTELSMVLSEMNREIPTWGLRKIESGGRRVDADDLVALAAALGVSPITLLMPETQAPEVKIFVSGASADIESLRMWDWLRAMKPVNGRDDIRSVFLFQTDSWPAWSKLPVADQIPTVAEIDEMKRRQGEHLRRRRAEKAAQKEQASDGDD